VHLNCQESWCAVKMHEERRWLHSTSENGTGLLRRPLARRFEALRVRWEETLRESRGRCVLDEPPL